jgi:hypothetical protein
MDAADLTLGARVQPGHNSWGAGSDGFAAQERDHRANPAAESSNRTGGQQQQPVFIRPPLSALMFPMVDYLARRAASFLVVISALSGVS